MELYFLKSAACLAVLLLFYKLLLERENMHVFKRFYLLAAVVAALAIPAITFTTFIEPSSETFQQVWMSSETATETVATNYWPNFLLGIYLMGVIFFGIKFFRNLRDLILKIKKNEKVRENDFTSVLLSEKTPPHTFFHYIFFNKQNYLRNEIPRDVKVHEEAHAFQKHSLDVIFVEILQIIFWINPLIFLLKNAVKLNHEFLADRAVIGQGYRTSEYQKTLLSYSSGELQSDLVNPINYSSIKKRFKVMKTQTSRNAIWARILILLPLTAVLLYGFSAREVVEREINSLSLETGNSMVFELSVDKTGAIFFNKNKLSITELKKLDFDKYESYSINASPDAPEEIIKAIVQIGAGKNKAGTVSVCNVADLLSEKNNPGMVSQQKLQQKKATKEEIAEYNRLVKYYNEMPKNNMVVKQEDINKIMAILSKMTPEQRKEAEKIKFEVPPPPPPAPASTPTKGELPPPPPPTVEVTGFPAPPSPPVPPARANGQLPSLPPTIEVAGVPALPPPPPPSPVEAVQGWVEEGAVFFFNGKPVSGKEALEIVQKNNGKNLSVHVEENNSKKTVRLSVKQ